MRHRIFPELTFFVVFCKTETKIIRKMLVNITKLIINSYLSKNAQIISIHIAVSDPQHMLFFIS